jgi:hypothetical protein
MASKLPDRLDSTLIETSRLIQNALARYRNLDGIETPGLDVLRSADLDPDRRRDLLHRMVCPDWPDLAKQFVEDLGYPGSGGFGSHPIHHRLLKAQLADCARMMPALLENNDFVETCLKRLAPPNNADSAGDPEALRAALERMWAFAGDLPPVHNTLKAHLLYHLLDARRRGNRYDEELFVTYLKLPRTAPYIHPVSLRRTAAAPRANLGADFKHLTRMPPLMDDEPLVRDYLFHIFRGASDAGPYGEFIEDSYVQRVFAEIKMLGGAADTARWVAMLSPQEARALHSRVDLEFPPDRRDDFPVEAPVCLDLWVKNVSTLIVRVFALNPFNYPSASDPEPSPRFPLPAETGSADP